MEGADAGEGAEAAASAPPAASLDLTNVRGFQVLPGALDAPQEGGSLDEETRRRELSKEFSARAARFAEAVDEAIVLANDGAIRWLGDPVAKLVAGDETLQPRAVVLADDALSAEGREAAQQRLTLWIAAHIRKTLGPLLALADPESSPEGVRDLALKLSQSLGILERDRVKAQVKALDQNARGALRKLGVRFGAHYLYVPALLKPGARALCAQLWALTRGPADKDVVADKLLHFASSGRTSFAAEPPASPEVYRVAGFRLCGDRAVRVDIVERLSDLIRAALPRHAPGDADGAGETSLVGFVVTNQMTSLTGCSGEHFASILRSLGFANHQVSKAAYLAARKAAEPSAPVVAIAEAPSAPPDEQGVAEGEQAVVLEPILEPILGPLSEPTAESFSEPALAPDVEGPSAETATASDATVFEVAPPASADEPSPSVDDVAGPANAPSVGEGAPSSDVPPPAAETPSPTAAGEEPRAGDDELIEIWRPAPRRPRHAGREHGRPQRPPQTAAPVEGRPPREGQQPRRPWRDRPRHGAPHVDKTDGAPSAEAQRPTSAPRPAGDPGPDPRRQPWRRDGAKGSRSDEGRSNEAGGDKGRPRSPPPEPRKPSVNLDSPFAKLLDLKPLLKSRDGSK